MNPVWSHYSSSSNTGQARQPQADYYGGGEPDNSFVVENGNNKDPTTIYGKGHPLNQDIVYDEWGLPVTTPESHNEGRNRCRTWILALNIVALAGLILVVLSGGPAVSDYEEYLYDMGSSHQEKTGISSRTTLTLLGEDELLGPMETQNKGIVGFGHNVAISESGDRLAVARTSGHGDAPGEIHVYSLSDNGQSWEKEQVLKSNLTSSSLSDIIINEESSDPITRQPTPLAMAANGKRIAYTQGNQVVVFEETLDKEERPWRQIATVLRSDSKVILGDVISSGSNTEKEKDGINRDRTLSEYTGNQQDRFGTHLAFGGNDEGSTLAIMGYNAQDQTGFVRMFHEQVDDDSGQHTLVSSTSSSDTIVLETNGDCLSLSSDETTLAVGITSVHHHDDDPRGKNQKEAGSVQVYTQTKDEDKDEWIALGGPIYGMKSFGTSVSLSKDGTILAAEGGGEVRVYQRIQNDGVDDEESAMEWTLYGQPLRGKNEYESFGAQISLSPDGSQLVVGAPGSQKLMLEYIGNTLDEALEPYLHGKVYVFQYDADASEWVEVGIAESLYKGDGFGRAVAVSADSAVVGAPYRVVNNIRNVGSVHVFDTSSGH